MIQKLLIKFALMVVLLLGTAMPSFAEGMVHFIGFNSLKVDNKAHHKDTFDAYIKRLKPILAKYDVTTDVYDVVFGGDGEIKADFITFGTAKDQQSFQAFFQDPEFHQIFPMLLGALDEHQVIFTAEAFSPDAEAIPGHTFLALNWLKGDVVEARKEVDALVQKLAPYNKKYGARKIAFGSGVYSNKGLAAEVVDTTAPQFVELWSIKDAHGLFEDIKAKEIFKETASIVERSESYWLQERKIH